MSHNLVDRFFSKMLQMLCKKIINAVQLPPQKHNPDAYGIVMLLLLVEERMQYLL